MSEFLDRLLKAELPNVMKDLPTKRFSIPRLAELAGGEAVVELWGLPYGKVQDIREKTRDQDVHIVLAGCPELKELAGTKALQERMGTVTPADTLKALLLAGEIEDLSREVEKLSGYRRQTIKEVKNG